MIAALRNGFGALARFSGRDRRALFWPYAGVVVLLAFAAMAAVMLPAMADSFAKMQRFAIEHPELATVQSSPDSYSIQIEGHHPELAPDFRGLFGGMGVVIFCAVALLAAGVARRLHDRGRSGLWGLMPLPFLAFGLVVFSRLTASFEGADPSIGLLIVAFGNNALYLAALATLIVMLSGPSTPGPNRFGDTP